MAEISGSSISTIDEGSRNLHRRLAEDPSARILTRELTVPAKTGEAFVVETGQILRVSCPEGPQVADLNAFSRAHPRQMFWSARTRMIHGAHLTVGDRLWSTPLDMKPMFTIIADTVEHEPLPFGARSHDLLYGRCNAQMYELVTGVMGLPNCQDNLANAISGFGLSGDHVHDAFNIFMTTGVDDEDQLFYLDPDAKTGDYLELYAEMDCIVAISACPSGPPAKPEEPPGTGEYSIGVKIFTPTVEP